MTYRAHHAQVFACQGKERYATKARALAVIRRRQRRARHHRNGHHEARRETALLAAYKCNFCHHWHVGSDHTGNRSKHAG